MLKYISDFEIVGEAKGVVYATVKIRSWRTLWLSKETAMIAKQPYSRFWIFTDSGAFTPGYRCEELYRAWEAKRIAAEFGLVK